MTIPRLLSDQEMQKFIRDGYVSVRVDLPSSFHDTLYEKTEKMFSSVGNPGNNLLPRLPEIQQVFSDPAVHGAMVSILGPDYYLHPHRHCHENTPDSGEQGMHKDSLHNSRFAVDDNHRHHHTRWAMAFYYPQDSLVEIGPTAIWPRSQYFNTQPPLERSDELALVGEAGTVAIVNYDVFHRKMLNQSEKTRYMMKFLFTRMSEPTYPSWNYQGTEWQESDDVQEQTWQYIWNWHLGHRNGSGQHATSETVSELTNLIGSDQEAVGIEAAYKLGRLGQQGLEPLIDATTGGDPVACRNAIYGFSHMGQEVVPSLIELLSHDQVDVRVRAADTLGDLGLQAKSSLPALFDKMSDQDDKVRHHAAEAMGTIALDDNTAVEPLTKALTDEVDLVRRNAALSLARIGRHATQAVPALTLALKDSNHFVRAFSVHALERNGTPEATATLLEHLRTVRWCPSH